MSATFSGFYVRNSEPGLWTVGFDHPGTGKWEPESDHDVEREAKQRAWLLNGIECRYAYMCTEPGLWTVGDFGYGSWDPVSDHHSRYDAAQQVIALNA